MLKRKLPRAPAIHRSADRFYHDPRNIATAPYFDLVFKNVAGIVPLSPLDPERIFPSFAWVLERLLPAGPFRLTSEFTAPSEEGSGARYIVIAAGGGLALPSSTASYSGAAISPQVWIDQTIEVIARSVGHLRQILEAGDNVRIYADVPGEALQKLASDLSEDLRFVFNKPSIAYYDDLVRASHLVFRAGAGATADAIATSLPAILWPLRDHEEQMQNALQEASRREHVQALMPGGGVEAAINRLLAAETSPRSPGAPDRSLAVAARIGAIVAADG